MVNKKWKPVIFRGESFEGLYEVSRQGQIRSARDTHQTKKGHVYSLHPMNGYLGLMLYRSSGGTANRVTAPVHRVMLETFVGPPPTPTHQCNHKNGDKTDNRLSNLEWCTPSSNKKHAFATGLQGRRRGADNHLAKLTDDKVREIRRLRALPRAERLMQKEVAEQFGITRALVSMIENGHVWTHLPVNKPKQRERIVRQPYRRRRRTTAKIRQPRRAQGEANAHARLTDEQVLEIRRLRSLPASERPLQQEVADQFDVARSLISLIENRKIWTHLRD